MGLEADKVTDEENDRIATKHEVLEYLTKVLRGEYEAEEKEINTRERMKAAELLGKRCGAFTNDRQEERKPNLIESIMRQLEED